MVDGICTRNFASRNLSWNFPGVGDGDIRYSNSRYRIPGTMWPREHRHGRCGAGGPFADDSIGVFYGGNKKHAVALMNPIKTRIVSGRKQIKNKPKTSNCNATRMAVPFAVFFYLPFPRHPFFPAGQNGTKVHYNARAEFSPPTYVVFAPFRPESTSLSDLFPITVRALYVG